MTERRHLGLVAENEPAADGPFVAELALPDDPYDTAGQLLYFAASVRFEASKLVEHDGGESEYARGDRVMCDSPEGVVMGEVVVPSRRVLRSVPPPRILRRATRGDMATLAQLRKREQDVFRVARDVARRLKLPVKVVRAEAVQGGAKFVISFASEAKVSFRDWLRGVGGESRERVEVHQIGMRDAARLIGGVGPCGLQLCCNTFLSDFTPVSIKSAKTQGLSLNPQKVSGLCGRLFCCLVYEEAHYRAAREALPEPGEGVDTDKGRGRVVDIDVLPMTVLVALEGGDTQRFPAADVRRLPKGR